MWAAIVAALLLVIGGAVAAVLLIGKSDNVKQVVIPQSIVGQLPAAASDTLRNLGFNPVQGSDTNGPCVGGATVDKGKVCLSDPAPNTKANKGATVTYQLYTPAQVQVPDVTGKQYTDAAATLHQSGLNAKQQLVHSAQPVGTVIQQSVPAFTPVAPGATITLSVSDGKVVLPDVVGKSLDARQVAAQRGRLDEYRLQPDHDDDRQEQGRHDRRRGPDAGNSVSAEPEGDADGLPLRRADADGLVFDTAADHVDHRVGTPPAVASRHGHATAGVHHESLGARPAGAPRRPGRVSRRRGR